MRIFTFMVSLMWAGMALAWEEPARGTDTRRAMMDALRPHVEWHLGAPIEFVVRDLRRAGTVGFASVQAQRPGGQQINQNETPGAVRGIIDPEEMDGASIQALYRKSGDTWVAVHWAIGATDVWWADPDLCPEYAAVTPEVCT